MAKVMTMEELLSGSSYNMELDKIKSRIKSLYRDMLTKVYKAANPGATVSDIQSFLDNNDIDFGEEKEEFDEDVESLENIMDQLLKVDEVDPVVDKEFSKPEVATGKEPKNKTHDKVKKFNTKALKIPKGGLFTPPDKHSLPKTSALPVPKGSIKRKIDDNPKVDKKTLKAVWDAERQKLLDLVAKRNREHGVIL